MNTMKWLLKREYWEHKGGFFWAPAVVSAILALFLGGTLLIGVTVGKNKGFEVNGIQMHDLSGVVDAHERANFITALTHGYIGTGFPLLAVLFFVVFFFCLGSLFDERKDRSILFWKSLPISDNETVLSKALTALVVAPLITIAFVVVTSVLSLAFLTIAAALMGLNVFGDVLSSGAVYAAPFKLAAILPVYAVWALPTVGWLMLVSAWARTKPFLWAVGVPVLTGALLSWFNAMFNFGWDVQWFWQHIVARGLLSVSPGSWFGFIDAQWHFHAHENNVIGTSDLLVQSWRALATANAWIGAAIGAAMIYGAARIRRWKDEG
jgi:ABC-2 type transport system permease protein